MTRGGLPPLLNQNYSVGQIRKYSAALHKRLGSEIDLDVGLAQVSNIGLARTQDGLDEYKYENKCYRGIGAARAPGRRNSNARPV